MLTKQGILLFSLIEEVMPILCHKHNTLTVLSLIRFHNTPINLIKMPWSKRTEVIALAYCFQSNHSMKLFVEDWVDNPGTLTFTPCALWPLQLWSDNPLRLCCFGALHSHYFSPSKTISITPEAECKGRPAPATKLACVRCTHTQLSLPKTLLHGNNWLTPQSVGVAHTWAHCLHWLLNARPSQHISACTGC